MKSPIKYCLVTIIAGSLLFTFCKKKDKVAEQPSTNPTTVIPSGDYGTFTSSYNGYEFADGSVYLDSAVQASFYDSPLFGHSNILAGVVSVNSKTLNVISNNFYSLSNQVNLKKLVWEITGSGTVTAGTFSYVPVYPVFTGANTIPDTITKANGMSFDLSGIDQTNSNFNLLMIGQGGATITRTVTSGTQKISISSAELADFTAGAGFTIYLSLFNYTHIVFNNKYYGVNANRTFTKFAYIK